MAMVLVKAKEVAANANGNVGIADAVMAVPHWFTDAQRKGRVLLCVVSNVMCVLSAHQL
jgi:molecular chaperone DnaK (HSP70)